MLIDSSIVIDYLRGKQPAIQFLDPLYQTAALSTHAVVAAEVLAGARDRKEQATIEALLTRFRTIHASEEDSADSIRYLRFYRLSHNAGWHDCLIASTCLRLAKPVATLNDRHFLVFPGLQVIRPY